MPNRRVTSKLCYCTIVFVDNKFIWASQIRAFHILPFSAFCSCDVVHPSCNLNWTFFLKWGLGVVKVKYNGIILSKRRIRRRSKGVNEFFDLILMLNNEWLESIMCLCLWEREREMIMGLCVCKSLSMVFHISRESWGELTMAEID